MTTNSSSQIAAVQTQSTAASTPTSSVRLAGFLKAQHIHKKDFADMIGVTLSYVYNLLDGTQSFSTRTTTLERIAVVMQTEPNTFPEYKGSAQAPKDALTDPGVRFLTDRQTRLGLSNVQLLKRLPKGLRLTMVDMWRGASPLPLDWSQLGALAQVLEISPAELYTYWQARLQQYLIGGGIEPMENMGLLNAMFDGAKTYLVTHQQP